MNILNDELQQILKEKISLQGRDSSKLLYLNGPSMVGKSITCNRLLMELSVESEFNQIYSVREANKATFLIEVFSKLLGFEGEISNLHKKFNQELINIRDNHPKALEDILRIVRMPTLPESILCKKLGTCPDLVDLSKHHLEEKIENFFRNINRIVTEAFIIDLLNQATVFDKIVDNSQEIELSKIFVLINGIDKFSTYINKILLDILEIINFSTLGDLDYYQFDDNLNSIKISQLIQSSFMFSTRRIYSVDNNDVEKFTIEKLNEDEIPMYLEYNEISDELELIDVFDETRGFPHLIDILSDIVESEQETITGNVISQRAAEQLLSVMLDEEKEWIRCAAYLGEFDAYGLRMFPQIGKFYEEVFEVFSIRSDIFDKASNTHLKMKEDYRYFIRTSTKSMSKKVDNALTEISEKYMEVEQIIRRIEHGEFNVLRTFAYFNAFDNNALEKTFLDDAELAKSFLIKYPKWFKENISTRVLKEDVKEILDNYNKLADGDRYKIKQERIFEVWQKREQEIKIEISQLNDELSKITDRSVSMDSEIRLNQSDYESYREEFFTIETEVIKLKSIIKRYNTRKSLNIGIIFFALAVILGGIGFFIPAEIIDDLQTIDFIKHSSVAFAAFFLIFSVVYFYKVISTGMKKKELRSLKSQFKELVSKRIDIERALERLEDKQKLDSDEISLNRERVAALEHSLNKLTISLDESYIKY
jgi:predicted  nucleic acid-binding Zn-ribbon protein